jgi:DNA-directed RNA polymerase specialized sigma24 family protein
MTITETFRAGDSGHSDPCDLATLAIARPCARAGADAEELLPEAFTRGVERGSALYAEEPAVAWFYRSLRNATVDHHRRADAERRGVAALAAERHGAGAATASPRR